MEVRDAEGSEFRNTGRETIDAFRKEMRLRRRPGEGVAGSLRGQPLEEGTRKLLRFIKRLDCFSLSVGEPREELLRLLESGAMVLMMYRFPAAPVPEH